MTMMTRLFSGAALGLVLGLGALPAAAETPPNMLVIANRIDDMITLDPAEVFEFSGGDVTQNIYDTLVAIDPLDLQGGYHPALAESWTVSEDGKTITFTIREGVTFHSGNPLTAEDVVYSLRRAVLLNKTPSFILTQFGFTPENVEQTITSDGNTVSITTDQTYATSFVLNCLTANIAGIVDMKTVMEHEADGDMGNAWLKTNSAGSGAYELVSWQPNDSVTLVAYPDHWRGTPGLERVLVRHVAESATQRLMLERGDIDVARNLNPEDVAGLEGTDGMEVKSEMRGQLMYISLNQKNEYLSKPEVIEAIKYLVDYEGMQNSFLKGQFTIHQNFLPSTYLGAIDDAPYTFDVDKAKELLADVGPFEINVGVRDSQDRLEIAQSLQNTFAEAGITLTIEVGTGGQILEKYRARQLDVYLGTWGPDYPDPHTNASTFAYNPDNADSAGNTGYLSWRNAWAAEELSPQVAAAVVEGDRDTRAKMYEDIQREFLKTAPFVIMFQQIEQYGIIDAVQNLSLGGAVQGVSYYPVTK